MPHRSTSSVRWAARYAVVDELWRGRARVIVDPVLEAVLRDGGPGVAHGSDPSLTQLVDDLVPAEPIDGEPVWMAVATPDVAAELGPTRPGTTFVPLPAIADVLSRAHWDVALVDLSADLDPRTRSSAGQRAAHALDELGIDGRRGRTVVLSVPVRDYPRTDIGLDYDEMATLVVEQLGGGRLYGLYAPPMIAVVEFGDLDDDQDDDDELDEDTAILLEQDDVPDDLEYEEALDDEDDDVPLTYDNTLGSQEPRLLEYLAIAGADAPVDGLALVELPAMDDIEDDAGARTQLASARRQADLAAIDRQAQLERAEGLERDNAELRRQVDDLRAELGSAADDSRRSAADGSEVTATEVALQAALAREQALRWRVTELEDALSQAMSRPVEELEAELASMREALRRGTNGQGRAPSESESESGSATVSEGVAVAVAMDLAMNASASASASGAEFQVRPAGSRAAVGRGRSGSVATAPLRLRIEALVRRIERGGIGTLELRRELVDLAKRLHS